MPRASEAYLVQIAEEFLVGQTAISWHDMTKSSLQGETTWIDPTESQPGIEVEMNYSRLTDAIEIEVIAYEPGEDGVPIQSVRRTGVVRKAQ